MKITASYAGRCTACKRPYKIGSTIEWTRETGARHDNPWCRDRQVEYNPQNLVPSRDEPIEVPATLEISKKQKVPQFPGLMKHQAEAVNTIKEGHDKLYLAFQQGTGKTFTSLAAAEVTKNYPLLIVCLASGKLNWKREAEKWIGRDSLVVGPKVKELSGDIVIINYDLLSKWQDRLIEFGFKAVLFDEAHMIKNPESKRTQAAVQIAKSIPGMRLLLSGTPTPNSVHDLVSPLEMLGYLDAFGGRDEFVGRYCPPTVTAYGLSYKNQQNLQELADNLKASCFIRRTKEDCLDLPEKTWVDVDLDLGNDHFFDAILKEMRNGSEQEALRAARKCYTWAELDQHIAKARAQVGEKKISAIVEITDSIAQAEQVVVMVHHRAVQEEVRKRLSKKHNVGYVTGGMTMKRRQQEIDDFTAGNTQVIVCSIQAAGTGINLQVASQMVIGELPMDYATLDQASDRIHRIGTKNKVTITKIVAVNTVDDLLLHIINSKAQVSSQVEDGKDADLSDIYDIVAARAVALYGKK